MSKPSDQKRSEPIAATVFCYAWESRSYGEIAKHSGYELSYVKQAGSQLWQLLSQALAQKVTNRNVRLILQRSLPLPESALPSALPAVGLTAESTASTAVSTAPDIDWGDAVDVSCFYGREAELKQLMQWTVGDRCRLIGIFGIGGIGKTALSIRLAQQLNQPSCFSKIIWRSLRNAPPLADLIADLLQVLSPSQATAKTLGQQLSHLLNCLRQHRCLIVLDNGETVMQPNETDSPSHYEMLWQQLGQTQHQSTILLTSREKPPSIAAYEGNALPVRSLRLTGLPANLAQSLFDLNGSFKGSAPQWQQLVDYHAGNPLALKMVATVIQELFDG